MPNRIGVPTPRTRRVTIIAQDPSIRRGRQIVTAEVAIPEEALQKGRGDIASTSSTTTPRSTGTGARRSSVTRKIRSGAKTPTG